MSLTWLDEQILRLEVCLKEAERFGEEFLAMRCRDRLAAAHMLRDMVPDQREPTE